MHVPGNKVDIVTMNRTFASPANLKTFHKFCCTIPVCHGYSSALYIYRSRYQYYIRNKMARTIAFLELKFQAADLSISKSSPHCVALNNVQIVILIPNQDSSNNLID